MNCPFCGNSDWQIINTPFVFEYYVVCYVCECTGPKAPTKERAEKLWNEQRAQGRIEQLESDCFTLAARLYGEDPLTFAPETIEAMERWRPIVTAKLEGKG